MPTPAISTTPKLTTRDRQASPCDPCELALSPRERQALSAELFEIRQALAAGTFEVPTPEQRDRYRTTLGTLLARLEVEPVN